MHWATKLDRGVGRGSNGRENAKAKRRKKKKKEETVGMGMGAEWGDEVGEIIKLKTNVSRIGIQYKPPSHYTPPPPHALY